MKASNNKEIFI